MGESKRTFKLGIAVAATLLAASCTAVPPGESAVPLEQRRIVDLTHTFDDATIYWPTAGDFELVSEFAGHTEAGFYYTANRFAAAEHGGTHLDAPIHFYEDRHSTDTIPLDRLIGPGVRIDVRQACQADRDHQVSVEDLQAWETRHGPIPEGAIVLLDTGFAQYWPDRERYMGSAERGQEAVAKLHFPGVSAEAAVWLADQRSIRALGLDTPSIDHGPSTRFEAHVALFERNVPAFENVAAMDALPATGFIVIALPMKIAGGSGGPLRIVALI